LSPTTGGHAINLKRYIGLVISIFGIGVLSTPNMACAQYAEGAVAVYYYIQGVGCGDCNLSLLEGAEDGWDQYDRAYYEMPYPTDAHVEVLGLIEGRKALGIVYPPLDGPLDESFSGCIVVSRGKSITLDNAAHYLRIACIGLDDFDIFIDGVNVRDNVQVDLGTITGTFGEGEHPTTSFTISVRPRPKVRVVETLAATEVTFTAATLNGQVSNNPSPCEYWFTYWTQGGSFYSTDRHCCANGDETFSVTVTGLKPDTTYSYQAHAEGLPDTGMTQTFTTPGLLPEDLSPTAPHILRIENVHTKSPTSAFYLICEAGATDQPCDFKDVEYVIQGEVTIPYIVSQVLDRETGQYRYLTTDVRGPETKGPVYFQQRIYSEFGFARISGGDTNLLRFAFPAEDKGRFAGRLITFQEYLPGTTDSNVPDPNAETYPLHDIRRLIADGNGVGTIVLADLPSKMPSGCLHYFILRADKISLADFNDDRVVDANDYAVVLRDLGKVGNSMGDMATLRTARS
jgi:hypothetical protein